MADEWYYSKQGERVGPVSDERLNQLVASGQVQPTDLVWKQGMAQWAQASQVFPQGDVGSSMPALATGLSATAASGLEPPVRKQSLRGKVKAAAQFGAKQAERTKLSTVTIPSMYQALGRHSFSSQQHRSEFIDLASEINRVATELQAPASSETGAREPRSLGEKAKAAANKAVKAAHLAKLSMQQSALFAKLGKAVYEKHHEGAGPEQLVLPITQAIARLGGSMRRSLKSQGNGSLATPRRIVIAAAALVVILGVISLLSVPSADSLMNMAASMTLLSSEEEARLKAAVSEGDALYEAGMREAKDAALGGRARAANSAALDGAFQKYLVVVNGTFPLADRAVMARVYGRVVDLAIDRENEALAKEVAIKALKHEILPAVISRKASPILSQARQAVQAQETEDMEWLDKHGDSIDSTESFGDEPLSAEVDWLSNESVPPSRPSRDSEGDAAPRGDYGEELVEKIQRGMSRQAVLGILGQPDLSMPLGQGHAMLYYLLSDTEAFFISIDKKGNVFFAARQDRSE